MIHFLNTAGLSLSQPWTNSAIKSRMRKAVAAHHFGLARRASTIQSASNAKCHRYEAKMYDEKDPGDVFAIPDLWRPSELLDDLLESNLIFSQLNFDGLFTYSLVR